MLRNMGSTKYSTAIVNISSCAYGHGAHAKTSHGFKCAHNSIVLRHKLQGIAMLSKSCSLLNQLQSTHLCAMSSYKRARCTFMACVKLLLVEQVMLCLVWEPLALLLSGTMQSWLTFVTLRCTANVHMFPGTAKGSEL